MNKLLICFFLVLTFFLVGCNSTIKSDLPKHHVTSVLGADLKLTLRIQNKSDYDWYIAASTFNMSSMNFDFIVDGRSIDLREVSELPNFLGMTIKVAKGDDFVKVIPLDGGAFPSLSKLVQTSSVLLRWSQEVSIYDGPILVKPSKLVLPLTSPKRERIKIRGKVWLSGN